MQSKHARAYRFAASVSAVLALATVAHAQTLIQQKAEERLTAAVHKLQAACSAELNQYCSTVTPGEGRLLLCLEAHEDKIGGKCDYSLFEASRNLEQALDNIALTADACWSDIEAHCANVPEGGGHIAQCLVDKRSSLSATCRSEMGRLFQIDK